ncbi:hypothetical protein WJX81_007136 [Elliptochloris bilobata]|uniref:Enoyl reductase (ER) domain-containing protein n=1 Tax=Elliptochloris bilobata TaxID=381761 RepID=A0AAW1S7L8_9CHLO
MDLPRTYKRLVGRRVGKSFREVCEEETVDISLPGEGEVLVKVLWAGINGGCETFRVRGDAYTPFARNASADKFLLGAECAGVVAAAGPGVSLKVGQAVTASGGLQSGGGFGEYLTAVAAQCFPVPAATPEAVALTLSAVTAAVALEVTGGPLRKGETALVTAAAGGTGHFGVQLALLAGCRVVATAGGEAKAQRLRDLGVHRVIDYKREDVRGVLDAEFPGQLDVVYEGVGGELFRAALGNLSPSGRLLSVGYISEYPHVSQGSGESAGAPQPSEVEGWKLPPARELFWGRQKLQRGDQTVHGDVWAGGDKEK